MNDERGLITSDFGIKQTGESVNRLQERWRDEILELDADFADKARTVLKNIEEDRALLTKDGQTIIEPVSDGGKDPTKLATKVVDSVVSKLTDILVECENEDPHDQKRAARIMYQFKRLTRGAPHKIGTYFKDYKVDQALCRYPSTENSNGYYFPDASVEEFQDEVEKLILEVLENQREKSVDI